MAVPPPHPRPMDPALPPEPDPFLALFETGRRLRLRPGTVLLGEGDASNRVVLVVSGRVKVSTVTDDGIETVHNFPGPGAVLGELSALDGEAHMATVTAVEDGEALVIPAARFLEALETDRGVALAVLRSLARRLRDSDIRRAEMVALDVTGRVAQRLVDLAAMTGEPTEDGVLIGIPISQRELAGYVGASREAVNKSLALLAEQGLVIAARRRLLVRDLEALRRRAG